MLEAGAAVSEAAKETSAAGDLATIVVVEDDPALRAFLCTALAEEFAVSGAVTGEEAIQLIRRLRPDIVILDVMLPGVSGLDVVRQIRAEPGLAQTPILVMTAFSDIEPAEAEEAGASRFLSKPFDVQELTAAVKELL
jgi:DNA-binding response OmpR family regulator